METCANCERKIGNLEIVHLVNNAPLCVECNAKLQANLQPVSRAITCPKCRSTSVAPDKQEFDLGRAGLGAILLGPLGLLGGTIGSKNVVLACLNCGCRWRAGEREPINKNHGLLFAVALGGAIGIILFIIVLVQVVES